MMLVCLTGLLPGPGLHSFLSDCSDSLSIMPALVLGVENSTLRYGLRFSVVKTLIHLPSGINPYLETGITIFDRINASPDDKKHIHLKAGLLFRIGPLALSIDSGLLYGNGKLGPTTGVGVWKFFTLYKVEAKKTVKDFPSYRAYVLWRNRYLKKKKRVLKGFSLSVRFFYNYALEPALSGGLFFDLYL